MSAYPENRERLIRLINHWHDQSGETWKTIADRGGISEQNLRRLRSDPTAKLTPQNKAGIEKGLRWKIGDVDRIMQDAAYAPEDRWLVLLGSPNDVILDFLKLYRAERPQDFRDTLLRLDVNWLDLQRDRPQAVSEPHEHP